MNLTDEEMVVIEGLLLGAINSYNKLIEKDYYFKKREKAVFEIAKNLLEKMEEYK